MAEYDNERKGVLFINDHKASDKHPDFKGQCTVEGIEYWLDAWKNVSQNGKKFLALKLRPKEQRTETPPGDDDSW